MAPTIQRAWNIATELNDQSDNLNRIMGRIVEAKIEGEDLTLAQRQALRSRATVIAQAMQALLDEFLAP